MSMCYVLYRVLHAGIFLRLY